VRLTRRHVILGLVIGWFLPVPFMLLGLGLNPPSRPLLSEDPRVSPVLSFEERRQRMTYHRRCQQSSDCEAPMGCIQDVRVFKHYCTDSQCMTDAQCPEGSICRGLNTIGGGPLVRFCIPLGVRKEGEGCIELAPDPKYACEPGLHCGGSRQEWCGRPCNWDGATSCPEGFFCAGLTPEPICLPTCETRGCPDGQHCIRHDNGASQCAVVYGPHCQQSPCPDDRECEDSTATSHPGKVWTECVERCGPDQPPCPTGFTCDRWHCLPSCDPQVPDTCANGYRCQQGKKPDRPWVCQPDT
jgi:hypothetical protein